MAAAGNVIWTIALLAVTPDDDRRYFSGLTIARLSVLLALAYYLFSEWLPLQEVKRRLDRVYCLGDCLLVSAGVLVAVAIQSPTIVVPGILRDTALPLLIGLMYLIAIVWHGALWWEPDARRSERWTKVGINAFGLASTMLIRLLVQPWFEDREATVFVMWAYFAVLAMVLVAWKIAQKRWPVRT